MNASPSRRFVLPVVLAAALLTTGCSTIRGFPDPPATSDKVHPDPTYLLGPDAIRRYVAESDAPRKLLLRNEIIDARMAEIDRRFAEFERAIYKEGVGSGIGTDWVVLAMAAATAMVSSAATQQDLAVATTAVIGGQAAFEKRALMDKTLPALMAQMVAQRETIRASIREGEDLTVDKYTWFAAQSDLESFAFAGSLPGALLSVAEDAGKKATDAKKAMRDMRKDVYKKDAAGDILFAFWMPDGKNVDSANEQRLKDWMTQNNISTAPGSIMMFLRGEMFVDARVQAVSDLNLSNK